MADFGSYNGNQAAKIKDGVLNINETYSVDDVDAVILGKSVLFEKVFTDTQLSASGGSIQILDTPLNTFPTLANVTSSIYDMSQQSFAYTYGEQFAWNIESITVHNELLTQEDSSTLDFKYNASNTTIFTSLVADNTTADIVDGIVNPSLSFSYGEGEANTIANDEIVMDLNQDDFNSDPSAFLFVRIIARVIPMTKTVVI